MMGAAGLAVEFPDISTVPADLVTPAMTDGEPRAGSRVKQTLAEWTGSGVYHALYMPTIGGVAANTR
jgi:hypothetical protein